MRVLLVDDEPLARALLRSLLADAGDVEVVGEAGSSAEAIAIAEQARPDAVFLDIDMPSGSGIGAAHELQRRSRVEIVFVTAHEPHAVDAYELGAIDYLLKPLRRPRLAKTLDRLRDKLARDHPNGRSPAAARAEGVFWVRTRAGTVRVQTSDIIWIEAARDHVYLHTATKCYLHRITMAELEHQLDGSGLVRVQRSAFVRLDRVSATRRRGKSLLLLLEDGTEVPVGPTYQNHTLAFLGCKLREPEASPAQL